MSTSYDNKFKISNEGKFQLTSKIEVMQSKDINVECILLLFSRFLI